MKLQQTIRDSVTHKMTSKVILWSVFIVSAVCLLPNEAHAQITIPISVNTTSDTIVAGACTSFPTGAGCSLRGAITAANANPSFSIIAFAIPASDPFCSAGACTINLASPLPAISTDTLIRGPGADKLTVKAAAGIQIRIFVVSVSVTVSGAVTISGLTISNGFAAGSAGGVATDGSGTVNITNCVISGNAAGTAGGGLYNSIGVMNVSNSTISGNIAGSGGGGGIVHLGGSLNVTNSTISGNNTSTGDGAGIRISNATANITNSTINGNIAGSAENGGGIDSSNGTVNVTNSTISNNTSGGCGGGIFKIGGAFSIKNTIVALNSGCTTSADVTGSFISAGFNLIGKRDGGNGFTEPTDQTGTIAMPLDPKLDPKGLQNNGGTTKTITLLSGSPAIDKGSSNGLTGNLTTDQRDTGSLRTTDDLGISNAVGGDGTDIGALERRESPADFDGDGITDISIFRPAPGEWWYLKSTGGNAAAQFGASTDKITPADFTGDGKTDIAFWRPSNGFWFVLRSEDFSFFSFPLGSNGDIPAPGDFDGDGKTDAAVFRPSGSTWFISRSAGGTTIQQFGANGDLPVGADYDGDGRSDIAIWRPGAGEWWIQRSSNNTVFALQFGQSTDKAVQGDYTGDGKTDIAFWRPSTGFWFILRSENFSFFSFPFGADGDVPSPGDYDGDGRFDATVFRPSSATWFSQRTSAGTQIVQFGIAGDLPVPNAFVP